MAPRRILVRVPNWVGDAVMATPALRALRAAQPDAEIALEGRAALEGLLRGLPFFDRFLAAPSGPRGALARARALRAERFEWAVLLPDSPRAALAPFLAGVSRRVGYARDPLRRALLTESLDPPRHNGRRLPIPMVERYLRITRQLGCEDQGERLELEVDPAVAERVERDLARHGVNPGTPVLVVAPGAGFGPSKLWPAEHFASACDGIARRHGLVPVLAPAPAELAIARAVTARMRERSVALLDTPLDLDLLKALVARAQLVLCNDSGPRQVAVALGRPVVVAMGPTDPRHSAHQLGLQRVLREDVPCSPCHYKTCPIDHRCLRGLRPERAVAAAAELLG
ncbi:MAG: lipopolysaccharide heptosyltransferase II [Myxococcota bacterium]